MSLLQDLTKEHIFAIAVEPEGDKTMRMNSQTARIEAGSVSLPGRAPLARRIPSRGRRFLAGVEPRQQ
jgi:phage terminase large subunit-like protein